MTKARYIGMTAIEFTQTITLGAGILAALVGAAGLATYFYGVKWKAAAIVNEATAKAWEDKANFLDEEVRLLRDKVAILDAQVKDLRKHDMESVLKSLALHEIQAADRHERTILVLSEIRDKMPGTP